MIEPSLTFVYFAPAWLELLRFQLQGMILDAVVYLCYFSKVFVHCIPYSGGRSLEYTRVSFKTISQVGMHELCN